MRLFKRNNFKADVTCRKNSYNNVLDMFKYDLRVNGDMAARMFVKMKNCRMYKVIQIAALYCLSIRKVSLKL